MDPAPKDITTLLKDLSGGKQQTMAALVPLLYAELRRLASHYLKQEHVDHTLQATALVHEAYLRLINQHEAQWENRNQFFGVAAQLMRRILVDYALDEALIKLAEVDPQQARIVELRFFGGLTVEQAADILSISPATVKRNWNVAKAWLARELEHNQSDV